MAPPSADKAISFTVNPGGGSFAENDWQARSNAPGVIFATDFRNPAHTTELRNTGHFQFQPCGIWEAFAPFNQAFRDTTVGLTGGACLRINRLNTGTANQASFVCSLNPGGFPGSSRLGGGWTLASQGIGSTRYWVQYRTWWPTERGQASPSGTDFKIAIFSNYKPENPYNSQSDVLSVVHTLVSTVAPQPLNGFFTIMYDSGQGSSGDGIWADNPGIPPGFINMQPGRDLGAPLPNYDRYCLYPWWQSSGCWRVPLATWITWDFEFRFQTYGGTLGNEVKCWATPFGSGTRLVLCDHAQDIYMASPSGTAYPGGQNGLWLLNYESNFDPNYINTYTLYDQLIVSLDPIALPAVGA